MNTTTIVNATTATPRPATTAWQALRGHWPEYLIEGWALGTFMVSAGLFATLFEAADSPLRQALANDDLRRVLVGIAMGLTAVALIYSPWGQRSGAHMNPAVTLSYLRLGKVRGWDAAFYMLAQFIGGTLGVLVALALLGEAFTAPPVSYAATLPGPDGPWVACLAEALISAGLMFTVLTVSSHPRLAARTGWFAGALVAIFITVEAPFSGMSMNPARSFASALPGGLWSGYWIYALAPLVGMQLGVALHLLRRHREETACAKLVHGAGQRCIHCGYEPPSTSGDSHAR
ncbi:MAG: aquaporin [Steroidobacteraceae bacterium]|nr:aquaporin [Steroidobacteraceae bacterium]